MLETSARLLRVLSLLQTPRDWTASELAERLDVTTRTIRADIDRLRSLGYPVHGTRGPAGGYRLGAGVTLPPLLLDDDEAIAVAIGLRTAAAGGVAGIEETALRALAKLEQVLPQRLRRRVGALATQIVTVPRNAAGPRVDPTVLLQIASSCRDHEGIRFDYQDRGKLVSTRMVEPYRVVNWGRRWYLVAWDPSRRDWRMFRVDRITLRVPGGPRFVPREPPDRDLAAYVSRQVAAAAWRYYATVTVHAPAETIAERVPSTAGTIEPLDGQTCRFETGADSIETLALYLGLLEADFEVTEPPELVAHLRVLADRYARAAPGASLTTNRRSAGKGLSRR